MPISAKLITVTPDAEKMIGYIARVSNPSNQDNEDVSKLLAYCARNKHWSVFEQAHMTIEIETSMAIGEQILRHRSFCFQKFSQRYADVTALGEMFMEVELRTQDHKNRQSSHDTLSQQIKDHYLARIQRHFQEAETLYRDMVQDGVAKECARFVLPMATKTRMYITGNVRSWLTYFMTRCEKATQKEHRDVAEACFQIFKKEMPIIAAVFEEEYGSQIGH